MEVEAQDSVGSQGPRRYEADSLFFLDSIMAREEYATGSALAMSEAQAAQAIADVSDLVGLPAGMSQRYCVAVCLSLEPSLSPHRIHWALGRHSDSCPRFMQTIH
jgi:hypothetical protein